MFDGYLITIGAYVIPLKYIKLDTYTATRNVQDVDSYRDANGYLHRSTIEHVPIKVEFETTELTNIDFDALMSGIRENYSVEQERKANAMIFVPETNNYEIQDVYMVQPQPKIKVIKNNVITYNSMKISFVGY